MTESSFYFYTQELKVTSSCFFLVQDFKFTVMEHKHKSSSSYSQDALGGHVAHFTLDMALFITFAAFELAKFVSFLYFFAFTIGTNQLASALTIWTLVSLVKLIEFCQTNTNEDFLKQRS